MYSAPMALLTELKSRLNTSDTTDDTVLAEMLLAVSGAIERAAGRKLRRQHCVREHFAGGTPLLRVANYPVAKIHWIRESEVYDFDDSDNYTELEDGVDYVLDASIAGRRPGEDGWIRRVGGNFMGSRRYPGMICVCYTGGFKTPGELALENSTVTIDGTTNTSLSDAFSVTRRYLSGVHDGYLTQFFADTVCKAGVEVSGNVSLVNRAIVVFQPGSVLIPTWKITAATLTLLHNRSDGAGGTSVDGFILPGKNPFDRLDDLETLYSDITDLTDGQILSNLTRSSSTLSSSALTIHSDTALAAAANLELLNDALRSNSHISFVFRHDAETVGTALAGGIATPDHATAGSRPSLVLVYRNTIANDPWIMPDDLKHATLLQVAQDWQVRRDPGFRQQTQRGVSIASGVSYLRDPAELLPIVRQIAESYAALV